MEEGARNQRQAAGPGLKSGVTDLRKYRANAGYGQAGARRDRHMASLLALGARTTPLFAVDKGRNHHQPLDRTLGLWWSVFEIRLRSIARPRRQSCSKSAEPIEPLRQTAFGLSTDL